ncbi:MAG: hypothetical protein AAFR87_19785 [Bacteroidota bacterium]
MLKPKQHVSYRASSRNLIPSATVFPHLKTSMGKKESNALGASQALADTYG